MKDKTSPENPEKIVPDASDAPQETELDPVVEELKVTKDQLLRLAAEFDNFKKRSQREREEAFLNTKAAMIKAFLPVLDNFERACGTEASGGSFEEYRKGVEMIYAQLAGVFEQQGVEIFAEAGESFDPACHNAVMHSENPDLGENVITEVFTKGCRLKDKIIREAVVGVAN